MFSNVFSVYLKRLVSLADPGKGGGGLGPEHHPWSM